MARLTAAAVVGLALLAACSGSSATRGSAVTTAARATTTAAVGATSTTVAAPTTTTTTVGRCTAASTELSALEGRVATGHALRIYAVRNTSARPCRTNGYPAVSLRDATGRALTRAEPGPGFILPGRPPTDVVVSPGQSAYFGIESTTLCAGDDQGTRSSTVQVTLPDDDAPAAVLADTSLVCSPPAIQVSPVRATIEGLTRP